MHTYKLTAVIGKEKEGYVSKCPETGVVSCGDFPEQALENLKEAVGVVPGECQAPRYVDGDAGGFNDLR